MKKTTLLNADTLLSHSSDIRKQLSLGSVAWSVLALLGAVAAWVISSHLDDRSSSLYMVMIIGAVVLAIIALYRLVSSSMQVVYVPTGSVIEKRFCYFEGDELQRVQAALTSADFTQLNNISKKQGGNVRLDYLLSRDGRFVALQLFQYVPYTYEPVTGIISFRDQDSKTLSAYLIRK